MSASTLAQRVDRAIDELETVKREITWLRMVPDKATDLKGQLAKEQGLLCSIFGRGGVYSELEAEIARIGGRVTTMSDTIARYEDFIADRLAGRDEESLIKSLCSTKLLPPSKSIAQQIATRELGRIRQDRDRLEKVHSSLIEKSSTLSGLNATSDTGMSAHDLDRLLDSGGKGDGVGHSGQTHVSTQVFGPVPDGGAADPFDNFGSPQRRWVLPTVILGAIAAVGALILAISQMPPTSPSKVSQDSRQADAEVARATDKDVRTGVSSLGLTDPSPVVMESNPEAVDPKPIAGVGDDKKKAQGKPAAEFEVPFNPDEVDGQCVDPCAGRASAKPQVASVNGCVTDVLYARFVSGEQSVDDGKVVAASTTKPTAVASKGVSRPVVDPNAASVARKMQQRLTCREQERRTAEACRRANTPICAMPRCTLRGK